MLTKYPNTIKEMYEAYIKCGNIMEVVTEYLPFFEERGEEITGLTLGGHILEYAKSANNLENLSK